LPARDGFDAKQYPLRIPLNGGQPRRLVLASNRGPIEYQLGEDDQLEATEGSGGVVKALSGLAPLADFAWVASAMTEGDRRVAWEGNGRSKIRLGEGQCRHRFVVIPQETYNLYYNVFSNPVLWFLQHSLSDGFNRPELEQQMQKAWEEGYLPANRAFAQAIVDELNGVQRPSYVMTQDYHLYMCPSYVREMAPRAILQHFVHIPWPAPEVWEQIPREFVEAICRSLLTTDVAGFQTEASARNFLRTCEAFLDHTRIDNAESVISYRGHRTRVRAYPISVDVEGLEGLMGSPEFALYRNRLSKLTGRYTIVKVDRLDPSKNVLRGLDAFDLLLQRHPELVGEAKLLAFLVPSRECVPEYKEYASRVSRRIAEINGRYSRDGWRPIEAFEENNYVQALAGMSLYDALLVNSVADGMNLVSKEGPILNERDGVVVLSKGAGSYNELREGVLSVEPKDLEGTADALWQALRMPGEEKQNRARYLRQVVGRRDLRAWLHRQLVDLNELVEERTAGPLQTVASKYIVF
jgi:trehalose 6-phosphate synthase